jgi:hypothetical protein
MYLANTQSNKKNKNKMNEDKSKQFKKEKNIIKLRRKIHNVGPSNKDLIIE